MKKFWKSPWTISIVSAIVGSIVTFVIDAIKDVPILFTLWTVIKTVWGWIITFLTFDLKVWWVLLGLGAIILVLIIIAKISKSKEGEPPAFLAYKKDKIGDWDWSWSWDFWITENKWHIKDLKAHCPKCDTPMFHDNWDTKFQCPRCNYETNYSTKFKRRSEVEAIIIDNVHRQYKNKED